MKNSPYVRSSLAQAALEHVPPLIRQTLIEQRDFRDEYGFRADAVIALGDSGISIPRSELFEAIRVVLGDRSEVVVGDTDGSDWKVFTEGEEGGQPRVLISRDDLRYNLPDFTALSPDRAIRLRSLEESASDVNLPTNTIVAWRGILSERGLEDDEVDQFHSEFRDTPVHIARLIRAEIQKGESSASSLVPPSRRYFARLVGEYDGSNSILDYAVGAGQNFMERVASWRPYDGFLSSLFLSSHSALTAEVGVERLDDKDIGRAFEFLVEQGDRLSQLGAVEAGLRILPERPEIEASLVRLVEQIRDDDVDGSMSGFKLFSALFILVDGELSRTRLFADCPPFYRRLASLAQAALIQRETVSASIEIDSFCEWAVNIRGEQFYLQSLADMRLEPRWNPDFVAASQIKADFLGRLMIGGKNYEKNIASSELQELLVGSESGSLHSQIDFPRPYLPGPLEGREASPIALPDELTKTVEAQLKEEEVSPSSFVTLVNSALIFHVDQSQAEMAAEALKVGKHRLASIEDRSQFLVILHGLATVSAVSRGQALADELRILVRRYRRDPKFALSLDETLRICLVASASRSDPKDWRENVGDWLTELAFEDFQGTEGASFYSHLQCLCHVVPELWVSCSKADAALSAYVSS
ncbi:MAG: hypothetical protein ACPGOV_14830 [Magnetovibrionaceae bacterium]